MYGASVAALPSGALKFLVQEKVQEKHIWGEGYIRDLASPQDFQDYRCFAII